MITVYLSSTFRDLKEYRRGVLDYFASMKDRFRVVNMEDYVAEDRTAISKCLSDVAACNLYILIIGKSYGSIAVDPTDPEFNKAGLSYTELEYLEARKSDKIEALIFSAAAEAQLPTDGQDDKLNAFRESFKGLLTPREFTSPTHLVMQIMQSLSYRYMSVRKYDERLAYTCDRIPHSSRFAIELRKQAVPFRSIMLYGKADELCRNLVNRLSIYNLSLDDRKLVAPLSFEDFISGDDYDGSLELFLNRVYELLHLPPRATLTVASLMADIRQKGDPAGIVLSCDAEYLEDAQVSFVQQFFSACRLATADDQNNLLYFFFCLEEDISAPDKLADGKITQVLQGMPDAATYNISLPRLGPITKRDIEAWLFKEITPDDGTATSIMDHYFAGLPKVNIPMQQAHDFIKVFLLSINSGSPEASSYLNLY